MNKTRLKELIELIDEEYSELQYDWSDFMTPQLGTECCPNCGHEQEVRQDGKSDCSNPAVLKISKSPCCSHKNILPCANCPLHIEFTFCDWTPEKHCTPFPIKSEVGCDVCDVCDGKGYLIDVYDTEAEETQTQRCDSCKQFESDKQAREHLNYYQLESEVE
jgi:hypothetical protein